MLRHVSEAFAEDPVRILRVARFAARFGFRVRRRDDGADAPDGGLAARPTTWCPSASGRSSPRAWPSRTGADVRGAGGVRPARRNSARDHPLPATLRGLGAGALRAAAWPLEERRSRRCARACGRRTRCASSRCCRPQPHRSCAARRPTELLDLLKTRGRLPPPGALRRAARGRRGSPSPASTRRASSARCARPPAVDAGAIAAKAAAPAEISGLLDEARTAGDRQA